MKRNDFEQADGHEAVGFTPCEHPATGQQGLEARRRFAAGELVAVFSVASVHAAPARLTMQVAEDAHVRFAQELLALTNHSCDPNVFFDVVGHRVVAVRDIAPGEALTCFYPATEWAMAEAFSCACGTARCLGVVAGASTATAESLAGRELAPHIRRLLAGRG